MKWEYNIWQYKQPAGMVFRGAGDIPATEITDALDTLGQDGWEAVSVFPVSMAQGATNMVGVLLKRPIG